MKQNSPSLFRNLAVGTFGKLLIVFSTKANLLYLLCSVAQGCCFLHLIKQNCLLKTFLRTLILMPQLSLYPSRTNRHVHEYEAFGCGVDILVAVTYLSVVIFQKQNQKMI